ncbi:MAG TPA: hypothetical protein VNU46_07430 [Gemmatimonadaceae bacterium]|nr:hypothetical protein [Gemmatimonadaceae bacterium]
MTTDDQPQRDLCRVDPRRAPRPCCASCSLPAARIGSAIESGIACPEVSSILTDESTTVAVARRPRRFSRRTSGDAPAAGAEPQRKKTGPCLFGT